MTAAKRSNGTANIRRPISQRLWLVNACVLLLDVCLQKHFHCCSEHTELSEEGMNVPFLFKNHFWFVVEAWSLVSRGLSLLLLQQPGNNCRMIFLLQAQSALWCWAGWTESEGTKQVQTYDSCLQTMASHGKLHPHQSNPSVSQHVPQKAGRRSGSSSVTIQHAMPSFGFMCA